MERSRLASGGDAGKQARLAVMALGRRLIDRLVRCAGSFNPEAGANDKRERDRSGIGLGHKPNWKKNARKHGEQSESPGTSPAAKLDVAVLERHRRILGAYRACQRN
jgi:hypothetical protein